MHYLLYKKLPDFLVGTRCYRGKYLNVKHCVNDN